ncbi:PilZ domain-containing protein [Vibrio marisflavi]|uniref:PilZ domain-containing protein n=1 Tax=Vibrio marisflavi CECT 7928 TaxID=634439 RepID=A0ABM9A3V4_9VIBR|nr:PilZ domain-containing protein [Vibrio marisflavi]CAH0539384.1 hypothetical protein VMF7928_02102 [Vibrio marisflavi CECT 7928]
MFRPKGNKYKQKREHFRLRYPKSDRPVIHLIDGNYLVSEISEKGLRVLMKNTSILCSGMSIHGVLTLHEDNEVNVEGYIRRFENDEVILELEKGPSLKMMESEKVHLRREFPLLVQNLQTVKSNKPLRKHH